MNRRLLGNSQIMIFVSSLFIPGSTVPLFKALAQVAGPDAWFSYFFSVSYGLAIGYILYKIAQRAPGKNLFEIATDWCGKAMGGILNGVLLLYLIHILIREVRVFADLIGNTYLPRTPLEYIVLLVIITLIYIGGGNIEELARAQTLIYFLFFLMLSYLPFLLINEMEMDSLQPILGNGLLNVFGSGLLSVGLAGDLIIMGAFLHYVRSVRGFYSSFKCSLFVTGLLNMALVLQTTAALDPVAVSRSTYPLYLMVQIIHITDFLDRLDLPLSAVWMPLYAMKSCIVYHAILVGFASYTKNRDFQVLNGMVGWFLLILTMVSFKSVMEFYRFTNWGQAPLAIGVELLFFGTLLAVYWLRKVKKPPPERGRINYQAWSAWMIGLASIVFGGIMGPLYKMYGLASAGMYLASYLFLIIASMKEYMKLPKADRGIL